VGKRDKEERYGGKDLEGEKEEETEGKNRGEKQVR
jgi:hypothetical protein